MFLDRFASIKPGGALDRAPHVVPLARFRRALRSGPSVLQRLARLLRAFAGATGPGAHLKLYLLITGSLFLTQMRPRAGDGQDPARWISRSKLGVHDGTGFERWPIGNKGYQSYIILSSSLEGNASAGVTSSSQAVTFLPFVTAAELSRRALPKTKAETLPTARGRQLRRLNHSLTDLWR